MLQCFNELSKNFSIFYFGLNDSQHSKGLEESYGLPNFEVCNIKLVWGRAKLIFTEQECASHNPVCEVKTNHPLMKTFSNSRPGAIMLNLFLGL